jgi:hypothetical protein
MEHVHNNARSLTALPLLWRLDSQHDALDNRVWLYDNENDFIIKWNPRVEKQKDWETYAKDLGHGCQWSEPREDKKVGIFTMYVNKKSNGVDYEFRRVMRVTIRHIDKKGQPLLVPETEIDGWWTTLELPDTQIIKLYQDHGTSEQFHSELKTDLDLERLPSGKFNTNVLVLNLGMIAYNILKHIGLKGLIGKDSPVRHQSKRRRIRTVIQELIYIPVQFIRKGRKFKLRFGKYCTAFKAFCKLYRHLSYR